MYGEAVHGEPMLVRRVRHKGLRRFIEDDDTGGVPADLRSRIRAILTALIAAQDIRGLEGPPGWRIHQLAGARSGTWSISVSGNWRITFIVEDGEVSDLDLEDYH